MKLQPVRGTQDLLPDLSRVFRQLDETAWTWAERFGYEELDTPIFEFSEVFHRTLGETSDTVSKETYTFADRGGDSLTLRPEGTAGVVRALISNGLAQHLPLKFYYSGPMFRYERPQKGRYRQFHQLGVECLGLENAASDVECISLGYLLLKDLGLAGKVKLEINSLGDPTSRNNHREALVRYLTPLRQSLSADSQVRLDKNPLRILDSKDPKDRELLQGAPKLSEFLNEDSKKFFDQVLEGLTSLGIPFQLTPQLVRGFDYYTHSVFEFTTEHLGAQSAVLSGGRYNGLVSLMGGPDTPGVGWAAGMERLALLLEASKLRPSPSKVAILAAEERADQEVLKLATELRVQGLSIELIFGTNVGKKMKRAAKLGCKAVVLIGGDELDQQTATVKDMGQGTQITVPRSQLLSSLKVLTDD